jgi:hypothetical protein
MERNRVISKQLRGWRANMGGDSSGRAQEPPDDEPRKAPFARGQRDRRDPSLHEPDFGEWTERATRVESRSTSPPDISADIFVGDERRHRQLLEAMPVYYSYAILTLLRQSEEAFGEFHSAFDFDKVMIDPGWIGRLAAYFAGYQDSDSGVIFEERLPTLDIEVARNFKVGFKNVYRTGRTSTFKMKVMGIGGSGARVVAQSLTTSFGPYARSCQLQAPVNVEWRSYTRASTGDTLLTLLFVPTGTVGLYVAAEGDPAYKRIDAARDAKLAIVNRSGEKPTEISWRIEKGFRSNFEVPINLSIGPFSSSHSILVDSEVMTEVALDLAHEGHGGHLYGCSRDAVLLRLGE